jgi:tetratricopeptide (TPR) repeat protein
MPNTVKSPSHGPLRDHLMKMNSELAEAANSTWRIAAQIHDCQTKPGGNIGGQAHVKAVERNIWRFLDETNDSSQERKKNLYNFTEIDLYLLSCAACCHDFDKGLHKELLPEPFVHGEGSGDFVYLNWEALGIITKGAAEYLRDIVRIHDFKEDFGAMLESIPDYYTLSNQTGNLRRLATLLKAADTLHLDETRIASIAVPDSGLKGFDRQKQIARGNIHGWRPDGERIVLRGSFDSKETQNALAECQKYIENVEWPPISRELNHFQFPYKLFFEFRKVSLPGDQRLNEGVASIKSEAVGLIQADMKESGTKGFTPLASTEPFCLIAVPPDKLAEHLCMSGPLSVIDNSYVEPTLTDLGSSAGAINRVFIGPANCGKTRAAFEWILHKVSLDIHNWVVIRPESGYIPEDAANFKLDKNMFFVEQGLPRNAILFVDDLPEFLPPPGSGSAASEAIQLLLRWFRHYSGFQDRCFVGTIRSERMHDKPGWPKKLVELGDLRLLGVKPLDENQRRSLWQGMSFGRSFRKDMYFKLDIQIEEEFLDIVTRCEADPESIAYYVRAMSEEGKVNIGADDAKNFNSDVVKLWSHLTWPSIRDTYGPAASVFLSLARFIEAGTRESSRFKGSLVPSWEYHAVLGPALLSENGGTPEEYVPILKRMLNDGHASGVEGERIRPRFDFLLQAETLGDAEISLPETSWFAHLAHGASPTAQRMIAFHLGYAEYFYWREDCSIHWLLGQAQALASLATYNTEKSNEYRERALTICDEINSSGVNESSEKTNETLAQVLFLKAISLGRLGRDEEELSVYEALALRYGDDETPGVREQVAKGIFNQGVALGLLGRDEEAITVYESLVSRYGDDETPGVREQVAMGIFNQGVALSRPGRDEEAITVYEALALRYGDDETPGVREKVAMGMVNQGVALSCLGRDEEELSVYEALALRYGDDETPGVREQVAMGMVNQGVALGLLGRDEEAITVYESLVSRYGDDETPGVREQVAKGMVNQGVALSRPGRDEEAITVYEALALRYGDDETPGVREQVAKGMVNQGVALGLLGRDEEAITVYEALALRYGDDETPGVREKVAMGMVNQGVVLSRLGRDEEAITVYEALALRYGDDETPGVREKVAMGMVNQGVALSCLGRDEEAITVYEALASRYGDDETPGVREEVARGLFNQGVVLSRLGRDEEAITVYESLVSRYGDDETPGVREEVARGMVNQGVALGRLGRDEEAITVYESLVSRYGDDETPGVREQVARGMVNQGVALGLLGRDEEAITVYESLVSRYGDDEAPGVREKVAMGMVNQGVALSRLGRDEEAITVYEALALRYGDDETPGVREKVAKGIFNQGVALSCLGRDEEELSVYEALALRYGDDETPGVREQVAMGMVNQGVALGLLGRDEEAITVYESLVSRYGDDETPGVREQVAKGMVNQGVALSRPGRDEEELSAYEALALRYGDDETPGVREKVARGMVNQGVALGRLGRDEEAITVYEALASRYGDDDTPGVCEVVADGLYIKSTALCRLWRKTNENDLLEEAIQTGRRAVEMGGGSYNLACALALKGESEEAFDILENSLEKEEIKWSFVAEDDDWESLRGEKRYMGLEEKYGDTEKDDVVPATLKSRGQVKRLTPWFFCQFNSNEPIKPILLKCFAAAFPAGLI